MNDTEKINKPKKESNDNYYYPAEKSHWEKYQLYYLVFGSFFFTLLIVLISNHNTNSQIKKINKRLDNPIELLGSWTRNFRNPGRDENSNEQNFFSPRHNHHNDDHEDHQSGDFISPSNDQKNENWLEETVFQESVREEFKIWVNSVKYLPRYRIGGQAEPEQHVLFYGPPGSGKSYLAEMFARNEGLAYIFAKFGFKIWAGSNQVEIDKKMKQAENLLKKHGNAKPVVFIVDEIDSLGIKHGHSHTSMQEVNSLLTMIDTIKQKNLNIIVIGITNYPDTLDPALKRAGRLGRQIKIPYLTKEEITKMVDYLKKDLKGEKLGAYKYEGNKPKWKDKDKDKDKEVEWTSAFWNEVLQTTFDAFERCQQNEVGISYTDLELSVKGAVAEKVGEDSKKVTPQSDDFKKELDKKVNDKIREKENRQPRRREEIPETPTKDK